MTRHRLRWFGLLALTAACGAVQAQVYSGASSNSGAIVLSNYRQGDATTLLIAAPLAPVAAGASAPLSSNSALLDRKLEDAAARTSLPAQLLHAVVRAESNYDVRALSKKGAMGLMQLMPDTARRFGARDAFDADQNITAGASYLRWLVDLFDQDLSLALAAYNAGEQAVLRAGRRIPDYPETQAYVRRVLALFASAAPSAGAAPGAPRGGIACRNDASGITCE
jgi:soluble lytic murein transglycosylase-like protein